LPRDRNLRHLALAGVLGVACWRLMHLTPMQPNQQRGFLVFTLALLAVGLACAVVMPGASKRLLRHTGLLVPLCLWVFAQEALSTAMAWSALAPLFSPSWSFNLFQIGVSLSLGFVLQVLLAVFYGAWTTVLVLQAVGSDRVDPGAGFPEAGRRFWRVLGAECIGWVVFFAGLGLVFAIGAALLPLALISVGVLSLAWNLATAALVPTVVASSGPFLQSVGEGIRTSWATKRRWWLAVVVQMLLLGWLTYFSVTYSTSGPGTFHTTHTTTMSVNGFWTGGYENECRWHTKLMAAVNAQPHPMVEFVLGLTFSVLAIVVKLKVVGEMYRPPGSGS
jgi:hypothetical protein